MNDFSKKKLYLAGPITGCGYNDARYGWRKEFVEMLAERGATHLECFSPMREKEFLSKEQAISGTADYESLHGFGTPYGILTRDHNDVRNCDAMVACFLGAKAVSIGTSVEFGMAFAYRKPVIMVMEPEVPLVDTIYTNIFVEDIIKKATPLVFQKFVSNVVKTDKWRIAGQEDDLAQGGTKYVIHHEKPTGSFKRNPHDHLFLRACAGYVVPTLKHAADIAQSLLTPGL